MDAIKNSDDIRKRIGLRIAAERVAKGLSQRQFALILEMDRATLNRIEAGKANPTLSTLIRIADGLDASIYDFFRD